MRIKMELGCGMTEIWMSGCGIKLLRWKRDLLFLTGGCGMYLKLQAGCGMRDEKQLRTATLTRWDREINIPCWTLCDQCPVSILREALLFCSQILRKFAVPSCRRSLFVFRGSQPLWTCEGFSQFPGLLHGWRRSLLPKMHENWSKGRPDVYTLLPTRQFPSSGRAMNIPPR